jgi:nucleotide-binding universal stress UspA family protein
MQTIIVPTDFSIAADNAIKFAKAIAKKTKATIHLANFYSLPIANYSYVENSMSGDMLNQVIEAAKIEIDKLTKTIEAEGVKVESTIAMGFATDEIVELANKIQPDLIIMGTTGATGIINKVIGSNAAHVMQHTNYPIILVPQDSTFSTISNVVYLDELKEDDTPVLKKLFDLADDLNIENIKLLNVNTGFFFQPIDEQLMIKLNNAFGLQKIKLETVQGADVVHGIEHYLEKHLVDLVVMSTHKKTLLERIFKKSDTNKMALYSKVPLLVYHKEG